MPIRDTNLTAETIVQRACEIALKSTILTELNSTLLSEVVNELRAVGVLVNVRQDESYLVSPVGVTGVLAPELMAAYRDRSLYSSPPEMSPFPEIKPHVLMLEVASGCHYGTCTFCTMFNDVPAKSKSFDEFVDHHRKVMERIGSRRESIERIFLSGGDIFAVEPATLVEILNFVKSQHSGVRRVSAYARADLLITYGGFGFLDEFVSAGLGLVYIGGESGSGEIARQLNKGVTQRQLYLALSLAQEARLDVSLSLMLGPGGVKYSEAHIEETAQLLNQVFVRFISFRNVTADEGSIYQRDMVRSLARKTNRPLTPVETVLQLKTILQRLNPKGQRISMLGAGLDPIATNPMNLSVNFDKKGKAKALKLCDECLLLVDTPKGELSASKNSRFREVVLE